MSCIEGNSIKWFYYENTSDSQPTTNVLYNGLALDPSWSSRGISVHYNNQTASQSILEIESVMTNVTGVYECSIIVDGNEDCKMWFCLTTGKQFTSHYLFQTMGSQLWWAYALLVALLICVVLVWYYVFCFVMVNKLSLSLPLSPSCSQASYWQWNFVWSCVILSYAGYHISPDLGQNPVIFLYPTKSGPAPARYDCRI